MSNNDWSYRKGMPRSQAHFNRYGNYDVPARRGMGGASLTNGSNSWLWLLALAGLLMIASKKR